METKAELYWRWSCPHCGHVWYKPFNKNSHTEIKVQECTFCEGSYIVKLESDMIPIE